MAKTKAKAARQLTSMVVQVGEEKSEVSSKGRIITKMEQLTRTMWDLALGKSYVEDGDEIVRPPDKDMIKFIYERVEGKVGTAQEAANKLSTAGKVTEQAKKRISSIGGSPDDSSTGT